MFPSMAPGVGGKKFKEFLAQHRPFPPTETILPEGALIPQGTLVKMKVKETPKASEKQ